MATPARGTETPKPLLLNASSAHRLVSSFFDREWPQTSSSSIHTKQLTGGLINTLQLVWRDNAALVEPAAVLIRHFGQSGHVEEPLATSMTLSAAQQAVVYLEMGRRGWGPGVYGLFPGGRLEEFIDAHTLTASESTQAAIMRDVARSYARLHSLPLPLRKDNFRLVVRELGEGIRDKHDEVVRTLLALKNPIAQEFATMFQNTGWMKELEWVSELFKKHNCKVTVTQGDTNHLNVLVKNSASSDCRVVLIDYETVTYSYRGSDLGGHFIERMYCHSQPGSKLTGYAAHDFEEQRFFCEAYLQEMRDLGEEMSEYDTVEHLVLEAEIGQLYQILFNNLMCTVFDEVEEDAHILSYLIHSMETYRQLKTEFMRSHQMQNSTV